MTTDDPLADLSPELRDGLLRMFAERDRQRAADVRRRWEALSRREQRLVREAAVMGYVQGVRSVPGSLNTKIPSDEAIVTTVIDACDSFPDLYPTIYRAGSRRRG